MSDYIREVTSEGVKPYGENTQSVAETAEKPADLISNDEIDNTAIAQVFGIEQKDFAENSDKINTIRDWAKAQGYENTDQLKWMLRSLMTKLGSPDWGESWITIASRYAYLDLEGRKMQAEKEGLLQ